ncbi:hypothetical protein CRG98_040582 [Punica granatum]|uniref:Uncharacterized protein n=1 Tax=Punica granatum TaxID=22663 RepID=A0A2I0I6H4_PUNGR|nr:hypothetical protein CRG98_040582 [Punica granatum]
MRGICGKKYGVVPWENPFLSHVRPMGCHVQETFVFGNLVITTLEWLDRDWGHISIFSQVARPELDAGPKPNAVNEGSKPNVVNARPKPDAEPKPKSRAETQCGAEAQYSPYRGGREKAVGGLPAKVGTTRRSGGVSGRDGLGFWSQRISLWRSEDHGWSTREGWHNSPVVRGGWPGWTAFGHSTSRRGEVKTVGGLPAKVGTTRLSCGVGGRDGRPLQKARLKENYGPTRRLDFGSVDGMKGWGLPIQGYQFLVIERGSLKKAKNELANKQTRSSLNPLRMSPVESPSCTNSNVDSRRGPHRSLLDCTAWECPPSSGDA